MRPALGGDRAGRYTLQEMWPKQSGERGIGAAGRRRSARAAATAGLVAVLCGCSRGSPSPEPRVGGALPEEAARERDERVTQPRVEQDSFGTLDGASVERFTLTNTHGLIVRVITYGATLTELFVPDRDGRLGDVLLGFDDLAGYIEHGSYMGAIVGRVANRIKDARFELDGRSYALAANDGADHLHGGRVGWDKALWSAEPSAGASSASVRLSHVSRDGDEGYPGTVSASVTYTLTDDDTLEIEMRAHADRTTLVNLVQHAYYNLGGAASGPVLDDVLELHADAYTPGDPQIPDGRVLGVAGTPFDFRQPRPVGAGLATSPETARGYDHNFVVRGEAGALRPVAQLTDPGSGRTLTLSANQPGVQLYTGNHFAGRFEGKGVPLDRHAGLCLETQAFPNAVNVPDWRGDVILEPGSEYHHRMVLRFSAEPRRAVAPGAAGPSSR